MFCSLYCYSHLAVNVSVTWLNVVNFLLLISFSSCFLTFEQKDGFEISAKLISETNLLKCLRFYLLLFLLLFRSP